MANTDRDARVVVRHPWRRVLTMAAWVAAPFVLAAASVPPVHAKTATTTVGVAASKPAAGDAQRPYLFRSPSGNINCAYFPADGDSFDVAIVSCEVLRFTGKAPKPPVDCDLDWVASATVRADRSRASLWSCQGDTIAGGPGTPTLAYGASVTRGPFRCSSSTAGIRCENTASRRGFSLSSKSVTGF